MSKLVVESGFFGTVVFAIITAVAVVPDNVSFVVVDLSVVEDRSVGSNMDDSGDVVTGP